MHDGAGAPRAPALCALHGLALGDAGCGDAEREVERESARSSRDDRPVLAPSPRRAGRGDRVARAPSKTSFVYIKPGLPSR